MTNAIAKKPLRQVGDIRELLVNDQARGQLAAVAAKHMSPERLMRVTANAIRTTPKLQEADPLSFLGALMQCAALGLEPNTVMGHAYLIPFDAKKKIRNDRGAWEWIKIPQVQLIIGYKGLIDLARRSGHITSISANIHYSDDDLWDYEEGTESRLRHRPGPLDGEKLHAYAIAKFTDGGHAYVVLPWSQVMKVRDGSQGWQSALKFGKTETSPWFTHEDAMAKKTAIRALAKYLPLSVEFRDAVQVDNDSGAHVDFAGYAMNPQDGAQIDGDYIEGEADVPEDNLLRADDAETADEKPEPEQKAVENKAKTEPKATKEKPDQEPEKKGAATVDVKHKTAFSHIESDLADGAPVSATRDFHADALKEMETEAPDLFAKAEELFAEYESEAD